MYIERLINWNGKKHETMNQSTYFVQHFAIYKSVYSSQKIIQIKQHTGPGMVCYLYPLIMFLCSLF